MKPNILFTALMITVCAVAQAQRPEASEVINKVDDNMSAKTRIMTSRMEIHSARASRSMEMKTWTIGDKKAFTEYIAPAREQGTKMLKLENQLWIFSPSTDRTIQISGHMLRQSVMGSDLSYEDLMNDKPLLDQYEPEITGEETLDSRNCWVITLTAKIPDVNYSTQKIWVDKERFILLRAEQFAKSGKKLKEITCSDIQQVQGRWYPMQFLYKDVLKSGKGTMLTILDIRLDEPIPDHIFNKANLR